MRLALRLADSIDRLNTQIGHAAAWLVLVVVLLQFALVVARYLFGLGSLWLSETVIYAHATLFLLAGAWTLSVDAHVRVDIFYADASLRAKAVIDLIGAVLLLLPFALVLLWLSWPYVERSWAILEHSQEASGLPLVFALKTLIPLFAALMAGYPVALTLAGVSLAFALLGDALGAMSFDILGALPQRVFGIMTNEVLLAIPLFIFMGVMLERSRIAEDLLETMGRLFGRLRGGLGFSVVIVGTLLAAAKGVVGATTVTMGLIMLPAMLRFGYDPRLAAGAVAATATLAQIFPPATVLVLLGDQLGNAYQAAQLAQGNFSPRSVNVGDLFAGALVPALALVALYFCYLVAVAMLFPARAPALPPDPKAPRGFAMARRLAEVLVAPLVLIVAVLGSILGGIATPTEAASIGAVGAILLATRKTTLATLLRPVCETTAQIVSMIFLILIGATMFRKI